MKSHLKRHGWIYVLCLALVVWPVILFALQSTTPLDFKTLRVVATRMDEHTERTYGGGSRRAEFLAIERKALRAFPNDLRMLRLSYAVADNLVAGTEALAPDLEAVLRVYAGGLEEWDRLAESRALHTVPFSWLVDRIEGPPRGVNRADLVKWDTSQPDTAIVYSMARLRCAVAVSLARLGDWTGALGQIRMGMRVSQPIARSSLNGHLTAAGTSRVMREACLQLLDLDPPAGAAREMLTMLVAAREQEPRIDRLTILRDYLTEVLELTTSPSGRRWGDGLGTTISTIHGFIELVSHPEAFGDPRLRRAAERFDERFARPERRGVRHSGLTWSDSFERFLADFRWTSLPAINRCLRDAARLEPGLIDAEVLPLDARAGLDPLTCLRLVPRFPPPGNLFGAEALPSLRKGTTMSRMTELAWASHVFRTERGRWPEDVADLVPSLVPPEPEMAAPASPFVLTDDRPYLPIQLGVRDMTPGLRGALWDARLPKRVMPWTTAHGFDVTRPSCDVNWVFRPDIAPRFVVVQAVIESLQSHPALATEVRGATTWDYRLAFKSTSPPEAWTPINPAQLRQWTDAADVVEWNRIRRRAGLQGSNPSTPAVGVYDPKDLEKALPPDQRDGPPSAGDPGPRLIEQLTARVTATIHSPEKAFIIWSAGPDGRDDDALIIHNPRNGVKSQGDMVVFPEKY